MPKLFHQILNYLERGTLFMLIQVDNERSLRSVYRDFYKKGMKIILIVQDL